jgi:hypothetical protein
MTEVLPRAGARSSPAGLTAVWESLDKNDFALVTDAQFVVIYVVDKVGGGAESTLHRFNDPDDVVLRTTLHPGDLLIFRDQAFLHSASPLIATGTTGARRDAVVCTVDYHDTYPWA